MRITMLVLCAGLLGGAASGTEPQRIPLMMQRASPQDLAIAGDVPGIPQGAERFISYAELSRLPQVTFTVRDDPNFHGPVELSGVPLDDIVRGLGFDGGKQLIAAMASDGYEGHYTAEYRAEHHPFLVLRIGGKEPGDWPPPPVGTTYGPYLISHSEFRPAFHVLAHADEAQVPYGVTTLRFFEEDAALAALRPRGDARPGSPAMEGLQIALQNCLRCHRAGEMGGTKSPFGWPVLAMMAQANPSMFGQYVVRPRFVNPGATMTANPEYDAATIAALTAYFRSFAGEQR